MGRCGEETRVSFRQSSEHQVNNDQICLTTWLSKYYFHVGGYRGTRPEVGVLGFIQISVALKYLLYSRYDLPVYPFNGFEDSVIILLCAATCKNAITNFCRNRAAPLEGSE